MLILVVALALPALAGSAAATAQEQAVVASIPFEVHTLGRLTAFVDPSLPSEQVPGCLARLGEAAAMLRGLMPLDEVPPPSAYFVGSPDGFGAVARQTLAFPSGVSGVAAVGTARGVAFNSGRYGLGATSRRAAGLRPLAWDPAAALAARRQAANMAT